MTARFHFWFKEHTNSFNWTVHSSLFDLSGPLLCLLSLSWFIRFSLCLRPACVLLSLGQPGKQLSSVCPRHVSGSLSLRQPGKQLSSVCPRHVSGSLSLRQPGKQLSSVCPQPASVSLSLGQPGKQKRMVIYQYTAYTMHSVHHKSAFISEISFEKSIL